ncbi:MAG: helix-turn-helix transcriptional regulator [Microthrixaceae bacterium]
MLNQTDTADALRRLRELSGLSRRGAARQMGMDKRTLRSWEDGHATPDRDQVDHATRVYGRGLDWLLADRQPITDPAEPGVLRVGSQTIDIAEIRRNHPVIHDSNRATLHAYVDAVRQVRGVPVKGIVELRSLDIRLLASELDISDPAIGDLLADVFNMTPAGAQSATRAMLIGSLMAVAAAGMIGATWFAPAASAAPPASAAVAPAATAPAATVLSATPTSTTPTSSSGPAAAVSSATESVEFAAYAAPSTPHWEVPTSSRTGVGPMFTTSPFGAGMSQETASGGYFDPLHDGSSNVFTVSPRHSSQQTDSASAVSGPSLGQGLQALPAGSHELPEN